MFQFIAPGPMHFMLLMVGLVASMLVTMECGWRLGRRRAQRDPEGAEKGIAELDSLVFALFGLMLAFTFSGAVQRFQDRRDLINDEANAIGTAYLRISLLPPDSQPLLRETFRHYVEVRLRAPKTMLEGGVDETSKVQTAIWNQAIAALQAHQGPPIVDAVLDPINEMIDLTSTRWLAARTHPPLAIFLLLIGMALACAFLVGHGMGASQRRYLAHALAFTLSISAVIYLLIDVEFPRAGLIQVSFADQVLENALNSMAPPP